jgi:excisionase family DNA binding protein
MITVREAAELLRVSQRTFYREIKRGKIPVIKIRGSVRIDPGDFGRYLQSCKVGAGYEGKGEKGRRSRSR